jgi:hypothetical protein
LAHQLGLTLAEVEAMAAQEVAAWQVYFELALEDNKPHGTQGPKLPHHGRKQNRPRL